MPQEVLWRIKEAFSDGCSTKENSWYQIIQQYVKNQLSHEKKEDFNEIMNQFSHQPPKFQEAYYYRMIFDQYYKNRDKLIPYYWVPKWSGDIAEPSARVLNVYNA